MSPWSRSTSAGTPGPGWRTAPAPAWAGSPSAITMTRRARSRPSLPGVRGGCPPPRRGPRGQRGDAAEEPIEETTLSPRQATYFWCRQWVGDADLARRLTSETLDGLGLGDRADEPGGD